MSYPINFTYLGFIFNALLDEGKFLNLSETHKKIEEKQLFEWLTERFDENIDIGLFSKEELNEIEDFFLSLSICVDENKKMGVFNNGLCLLVAYCFEALQNKPDNIK